MIDRRTIFEIHRLFNEGLSERRIAKGLLISRKSVAKYLETPNPERPLIVRASKLDPFKEEIDRFLKIDASVSAAVIHLPNLRKYGHLPHPINVSFRLYLL